MTGSNPEGRFFGEATGRTHRDAMPLLLPLLDLTVGGAAFIGSLMNEELIDEVCLTVHPLVLGRGKALFKDVYQRHALELVEARALEGGRVSLSYRAPAPTTSVK